MIALDPETLKTIADTLLSLCAKDPERPFVSDRTLAARARREAERAPNLEPRAPDPAKELLREECAEVMKLANLTARQRDTVLLRLEGRTFEEIAQFNGRSKQAAQQVYALALKKLAHAFTVYPFRGLAEVYRSEVRRGMRGSGGLVEFKSSRKKD
jgi:hypothetical protein